MLAFSHGILLSLGLILPLGVQNVFIFNQGATQATYLRTLPVILTASICDTLLIILAVSGMTVFIFEIEWLKNLFMLFGSFFLLYMGRTLWYETIKDLKQEKQALSPKKQVAFALSVSLLNPHAILDTVGVIGTSSLVYSGLDKYFFAIACITVSWVWFFLLALLGKLIGRLPTAKTLQKNINRLSAIIIGVIALLLLYQFLIQI